MTGTMSPLRTTLAIVACLMGAAGVAAAAAAAHVAGEQLAPAAQLLMVHAAATLALLAFSGDGRRMVYPVVAMQAGTILFSADMAARFLAGHALFPMAAPTGGSLVILSWLLAAALLLGGGLRQTGH